MGRNCAALFNLKFEVKLLNSVGFLLAVDYAFASEAVVTRREVVCLFLRRRFNFCILSHTHSFRSFGSSCSAAVSSSSDFVQSVRVSIGYHLEEALFDVVELDLLLGLDLILINNNFFLWTLGLFSLSFLVV